jgi:hypothetical protein
MEQWELANMELKRLLKNKKNMGLIVGAVVILSTLLWLMFCGGNDANRVLWIPRGFVHLNSNLKHGVTVMPFETHIWFIDSEGNDIFHTDFKNMSFIVRYNRPFHQLNKTQQMPINRIWRIK